jgi:hypothetical protein
MEVDLIDLRAGLRSSRHKQRNPTSRFWRFARMIER